MKAPWNRVVRIPDDDTNNAPMAGGISPRTRTLSRLSEKPDGGNSLDVVRTEINPQKEDIKMSLSRSLFVVAFACAVPLGAQAHTGGGDFVPTRLMAMPADDLVVTPSENSIEAEAPVEMARRGRGRGRGRGGDRDRNDDQDRARDRDDDRGGSGSGRSKPRVPGGSGCDDAHDVAEHPECRG